MAPEGSEGAPEDVSIRIVAGAAVFWTGMDVVDTRGEGELIEDDKCLYKPWFGE